MNSVNSTNGHPNGHLIVALFAVQSHQTWSDFPNQSNDIKPGILFVVRGKEYIGLPFEIIDEKTIQSYLQGDSEAAKRIASIGRNKLHAHAAVFYVGSSLRKVWNQPGEWNRLPAMFYVFFFEGAHIENHFDGTFVIDPADLTQHDADLRHTIGDRLPDITVDMIRKGLNGSLTKKSSCLNFA